MSGTNRQVILFCARFPCSPAIFWALKSLEIFWEVNFDQIVLIPKNNVDCSYALRQDGNSQKLVEYVL